MASRIEAGMTIEGSIRGEGELEVAGRVRGALTLHGTLVVEPGGIVEADVEADNIQVQGLLAGSATAHETVTVSPGGRLEARVKAPRLMVEDGAMFRGELLAPPGATGAEAAVPAIEPASRKRRSQLPAPRAPAPPAAAATPVLRDVASQSGHEPTHQGRRGGVFAAPSRGATAPVTARTPPDEPRAPRSAKRSDRSSGPPRMPSMPKGRSVVGRRGGST